MSLPPSWKAPSNLGRLMEGPARTTPDRPAIHQGGQVLTYRELDERCDRVAAGLDALGIQPGERVALLYGNEPGFLETF
ncbi:MAG TPA: AMP-binding protein, partial [Vicinamibacteria bacterium]|nr:AMP-binding protein [Vicinamibacteria bacterium]